MALLNVDFFSDVLGMGMQMNVILPQKSYNQIGMPSSDKDGYYPTLYLLHGMSDDHTTWQRRTSIERYVANMGIAVVMPSTHLGWYTDMAVGSRYFTFISDELPKICRDFFPRMSPRREDTFVAGLSMGGYGAFKLGLNCPETFGAAASLSGALDMASRAFDDGLPEWIKSSVFGGTENIKGTSNDLMHCVDVLKASGKPMPSFYMWCGTEDFFYGQNLKMRDKMLEAGLDLTFEDSPGLHNWDFWDKKIQSVLTWLPLK